VIRVETLFRSFTRVVAETKPRFFVMENVKGILSAAVSTAHSISVDQVIVD